MTTRFLHLFPRERHRTILEGLLPILRPGGILIVEHDGPIFDRLRAVIRRMRGKPLSRVSSYHPAEQPFGARRVARWGASAPLLPGVSKRAPALARMLAAAVMHAPLHHIAKFVVVVYQKNNRPVPENDRTRNDPMASAGHSGVQAEDA
jgi:hypothetical protein